jgi:isopenicillin-N N-acyltransferase like protein
MAAENGGSLPIIELRGSARERGLAHGEELRDLIAHGLEIWFQRLATDGSSPQQTIDEFLQQSDHLRAAEQWTPAVMEEIRGIAEGAGVRFETLFAYNLADEQLIFFDLLGKCSTVGLRAGADGAPISGQTLDTPGWFKDTKVALSIHEQESGLDVLSFTIAGIVALCGVNSAGVSVWCNAVYQLANSPSGVPVACIARTVLAQATLREAEEFVHGIPHASGQNYLIGSPDGIVSLECSARSVAEARPSGSAVWHTNHPLENKDRIDPTAGENSLARDAFAGAQLAHATNASDLQDILSDRTVPVCKVESEADDFGYTLWAVVVEHTVPPRVHVTPGPPAQLPWQELWHGPERVAVAVGP